MVFGSGVFGSGVFGSSGVTAGPGSPFAGLPLTVRVGNRHITNLISGLQFRKEAIGGGVYLSMRLYQPLARFDTDVQGLAKVYLYDARSAETLWEGRLTDLGRTAGADGQAWDLVAFGPKIHATDTTQALIYVDTRLDEWRRSMFSTRNATTQTDERGEDTPTLLVAAEEGKTIATSWQGSWGYRAVRRAGMKLARIRCDWDAGVTNTDFDLMIHTHEGDNVSGGAADTDDANTAGGTLSTVVGDANFPNGRDVAELRVERNNTAGTGIEDHWFEFYDISVKALRVDKTGAEITTGYGSGVTVTAAEIVEDLLGRVLNQYDGANATVDTTGTYTIDQAAWPDGVTAEQVLADLMVLEPAFRWYCKHDVTGDGYQFFWEPWPTTVRYEATLDDGGSFPSSWQEVFNKVTVRWTGRRGEPRTTEVESTVDRFDAEGIVRSTVIDLADEVGSSAAATRAGENFLADHAVPKNAGTLTISRPVRDLTSGRMVWPFELVEGELIRVRGIESYPDALNASSNDGLTVFRMHAVQFDSDACSASVELDADSRTQANALRKLAKRRHRKR